MLCPACKIELKMADRTGVEIDYCPQCRGVWLDRGELDKIIERAAPSSRPPEPEAPRPRPAEARPRGRDWDDDDDDDRRKYHGKKKSFLGELFDF